MADDNTTSARILRYLATRGSATGPELAEHLGITRQAVSLQVRKLIDDRKLVKTGSTKAARYFSLDSAPDARRYGRELPLADLDEADVYDEAVIRLNLKTQHENVEAILHYAFTEMLNNAIDHSEADTCSVDIRVDAAGIRFAVRDRGIGVFHSIASKLALDDEHAALVELVK